MPTTQLDSIYIYPIKSCAPIRLSTAQIDEFGLPFDRRLILSDPEGNMLTARQIPELLLFRVLLRQDGVEIIAPDGEHITLRYPELMYTYFQVEVWGDEINAQHCGETLDTWFSEKLKRPCRLLFFGEQSERHTSRRPDKSVAFADGYPLLVISQASLDDLNRRSSTPLKMANFRPNLVIKNTSPFAEDSWKRIRIGEVEFEVVKPCSRCVMTTYDPQTATALPTAEPLKTLLNFRRGQDGEVYFGQNLVALNQGAIRENDPVEVLETQTPEVYPDHAPYLWPDQMRLRSEAQPTWTPDTLSPLTCTARIQETPDVVTFRFTPPAEVQCEYQAGQHITLSVPLPVVTERCYTLSSSPSRPTDLAITVKRVRENSVSAWLHDHLQPGMQLMARGPAGQFHAHSSGHAKRLMLSAGSGITPLLSMVRYLTDIQSDIDIVFLYQARTRADLICIDELRWLARQNRNLQLHFCLTQPDPQWLELSGRLDRDQLLAAVPDLMERAVYCCGPQGFMTQAKDICRQLGMAEQNWFQESFTLTTADPTQPDKQEVQICFDGNHCFTGDNQQPLLQQAESHGLKLAYGCRAGICGSCKVRLKQGDVERLSELPLSDAEKSEGIILACSCIPRSDLNIEIL
ncbi:hybrid-cluster NAD(P)-dependent oxidoreductase [Neptuniibacter sp. CAU 1671]|uniref:hybrid-cluster NAD(P)-dependent oxidoreductase n=1 Tax=Neptuniibacter sp. CAU 1671 TaxID=3032593 RepID=UPI0023DC3E97|nr:hybrid-cluster NAD(P)-dependent oxidoreductase [Neptuniibacter sp. CAU 1671]MDF2181127.1 hybrid-cluster NAD(P)-dependent oxidoreductase [Neptuniibacter sp. CAU 1671]